MKLIFFGANLNCINNVKNEINLEKNEIICFLDNNVNIQGKFVMDKYLVDSPNNINKYNYDYIIILANVLNKDILFNQLLNLGVDENKILFNWKYIYHMNEEKNLFLRDEMINVYKDYNYIKECIEFYMECNSYCESLRSKSKNEDVLIINGIKYSSEILNLNYDLFKYEFIDILAPYTISKKDQPVFFEGPYEYKDVYIKEDDFVFDLGANMGLFTGVAANKAVNGKVFSFEPVSKTFNSLSKTISYYNNVVGVKKGLFNFNKNLEIDLSTYEENQGSSTIVKEVSKNNTVTNSEVIEVITLDDFVKDNNISKVDFIKADIEGSERYMLMGAKEILKKFSPKLSICTYHLPDDPEVLEKIILDSNPNYIVEHKWSKLYAYVPNF